MSGITNWSEALADPCFWVGRYAQNRPGDRDVEKDIEAFFGRSFEACEPFHLRLYGNIDYDTPLFADDADDETEPPASPDEEYDYSDYDDQIPPTSILRLPFPESYTWQLEFADYQVTHLIYHPEVYPGGRAIAVEGHTSLLPGLRWAELKQMVACLLPPDWSPVFDPHILYPLLYPIVDPVTLAEYDEVRQTLRAAWGALRIVPPLQLEPWLDVRINVFENGRLLAHDETLEWNDRATRRAPADIQDPKVIETDWTVVAGDMWARDPDGGWFIHWPVWQPATSRTNDAGSFAPFFEMLERQTQPHS